MWLLLVDLLKTPYNLFTKQDYPSPGFLKKILIDEQVSPIFAINQNKSEVFRQFEVNFIIVSSLSLGSRTMTTTSSRVRDFLNAK